MVVAQQEEGRGCRGFGTMGPSQAGGLAREKSGLDLEQGQELDVKEDWMDRKGFGRRA